MEKRIGKKIYLIFFLFFLVVLLFSVLEYKTEKRGNRRIFYFSALNSADIYNEIRYEPSEISGDRLREVRYFVDELLLGAMTNRFRPLFSVGTKVLFCHLDGDVLYVNLSEDALLEKGGALSIKDGTDFFRMNVLKNFGNINTIMMFIGGKQIVYDELVND